MGVNFEQVRFELPPAIDVAAAESLRRRPGLSAWRYVLAFVLTDPAVPRRFGSLWIRGPASAADVDRHRTFLLSNGPFSSEHCNPLKPAVAQYASTNAALPYGRSNEPFPLAARRTTTIPLRVRTASAGFEQAAAMSPLLKAAFFEIVGLWSLWSIVSDLRTGIASNGRMPIDMQGQRRRVLSHGRLQGGVRLLRHGSPAECARADRRSLRLDRAHLPIPGAS